MRKLLACILALCFILSPASGQVSGGVHQHGAVTPGDCTSWYGTNSIQDSGGACGGGGGSVSVTAANQGIVVNPSPGTGTFTLALNTPTTGALGGIEALASAVSNNFVTYVDTSGVQHTAQPAFSNLSGQATNAQLATQTANTVLGALTATTPSGLSVPSCSGASNALTWTSGTGFGCNTIASGGSGTVNSGTQYQLGYYATSTTAISGTSSIVTDSAGDLTMVQPTAANSGAAAISNAFVLGANGWTGSASTAANMTETWLPGNNTSVSGALTYTLATAATGYTGYNQVKYSGTNVVLEANNTNDSAFGFFGETYNNAQFGYGTGTATNPTLTSSLYISSGGAIATGKSSFGSPTYRNTLDDGTTNANATFHTNVTSPTITATTNIVSPSFNSGPQAGNRNIIINGDMRLDQRNQGSSQAFTAGAALAYTVDRWFGYSTGGNPTGQRVAGADGQHQYVYQFTGAASTTGIYFGQRIEASNSEYLAGQSVTLGVDLADSTLTSATCALSYANTTNAFGTVASPTVTAIASTTFTITSSLTRYNYTFSVPSGATTGLQLLCNVGAQTSGTFQVGNVQLEIGTQATPFERRPIGLETSLAQRYYWRWDSNSQAFTYIAFARPYSATHATVILRLPQPMFAVPVMTSSTVNSTNWDYSVTSFSLGPVPLDNSAVDLDVVGTFTSGTISALGSATTTDEWIGFTAEL